MSPNSTISNTNVSLSDYRFVSDIPTRWHDNDIYGHINNVVYYAFFDTTVNNYLIAAGLDIHTDAVVAFVVNSECNYLKPLAYPDVVSVGLGVGRLGNSSVRYELAVFHKESGECCAMGSFTHVFVNRQDNVSVPVPDALRQALQQLMLPS